MVQLNKEKNKKINLKMEDVKVYFLHHIFLLSDKNATQTFKQDFFSLEKCY